MSNMKRISFWDNARFLLILFVVIAHFADSIVGCSQIGKAVYVFMYAFHMPMFLFISGLFTQYDDGRRLRVDKVIFYIIIGYAMKAVMYTMYYVAGENHGWSWFSTSNAPWYMFVLAGYLVLTFLLKKVNKYAVFAIGLTISLVIGFFSFNHDLFCISKFIVFFPFFWVGFCLSPDKILNIINNKVVKAGGIAITAVFAALCVFVTDYTYSLRPVFSARHNYADFPLSHLGIIIRVCWYVLAFAMIAGIFALVPKNEIKYITKAGSRTLQIYFIHYPVVKVLSAIGIDDMLINAFGALGAVLWLLIAVLITFIIAIPLLEIPFAFLSKLITKGCNKLLKKG